MKIFEDWKSSTTIPIYKGKVYTMITDLGS